MEHVILVDENDQQVGIMEKMEAHSKAVLHRAFSVFVFNDFGEMLLQQRAQINTIVAAYGPTPVAAIPGQAKKP